MLTLLTSCVVDFLCCSVICSICQCALAGEESVLQLPCKHDFHEGCVSQWLRQYSKKCPVCKTEVCE